MRPDRIAAAPPEDGAAGSDDTRRARRAATVSAAGGARLAIGLVGALAIVWDGRPAGLPARLRSQKLLAAVVLHPRGIRRRAVAGLLWPQATDGQAGAALRRHLTDLEGYLEALTGRGPWIRRDGDRLTWAPCAPCRVDAVAIVDAVPSLGPASACAPADPELARWIVAAARHPLLSAWDDAWLVEHRRLVASAARMRLRSVVDDRAAAGDLDGAAEALEALVDAGDRDTGAGALLAVLRGRGGDSGERPGTAAADGPHRAEPARLAVGDPAAFTFAAVRLRLSIRHAVDVARLVVDPGLDAYIADPSTVDDLARAAAGGGVVTVAGPIGVGKSRLVHEVMRRRRRECGAVFHIVDAAAFGRAEAIQWLLLTAVAEGLLRRGAPTRGRAAADPPGGAAHWVLIDHADGWLDALEPLAASLAQAWPHLTVVLASRAPARGGRHPRLAVRPLPLDAPAASGAARDAAEAAAVPDASPALSPALSPAGRLFAARCDEVRPRGAPWTDADAAAIATVCACAGGVPLYVEYLARLVEHLTLGELAHRVAHAGYARDEARAARLTVPGWLSRLDAAFGALSVGARRVLQAACLLDDLADADALRAVLPVEAAPDADAADVAAALDGLAEGGWLVEAGPGEGGRRVPPLLRQQVVERLSPPLERAVLAQRAVDVHLTRLAAASLRLVPADRSDADGAVTAQLQLRWLPFTRTAELGPTAVARAILAAGLLWRLWVERGLAATAIDWLRSVDAAAGDRIDPVTRAVGLDALGMLHYAGGELQPALSCCGRACALSVEAGVAGLHALHLIHLAGVQAMHGHGAEATVHALTAVAALGTRADATTRIDVLVLAADICLRTGSVDAADALLHAAKDVDRRLIPHSSRFGRILLRMGTIATERGAYASAEAILAEASQLMAVHGNRRERNRTEAERSLAMRWRGRPADAERVLAAVLRDCDRSDDHLLRATCLCNMADLWCDEMRWPMAEVALRQIADLEPLELTEDLQLDIDNVRAMMAVHRGDRPAARRLGAAMADRLPRVTDAVSAGWACRTLGRVMALDGDVPAARRLHRASIAHFERGGNRGGLIRSVEAAAGALVDDDPRWVLAVLDGCDAERRQLGAPRSPREEVDVAAWRDRAVRAGAPGGPMMAMDEAPTLARLAEAVTARLAESA